jgi:hypothetical protein
MMMWMYGRLFAVSLLAGCGFQIGAGSAVTGDAAPADAIADAAIDGATITDDAIDAPVPDGPKRRVKLMFQNAGRPALDGFVALVVLTPAKVDYGAITANGGNLRFTDADGTPLPYQIDEWVAAGTSYVWVRVPLIDASNTDFIYLHYGDAALTDAQNPAAVWGGMQGVWHLSQDPGPGAPNDIKDSSPVGRHGTATPQMQSADRVAAIVGNGYQFSAAGGTGVTASAAPMGTYTWMMWLRGNAAPVSGMSNHEPLSDGDTNFNFAWDHTLSGYTGATAQKDAQAWSAAQLTSWAGQTWYFIASTYDGTNLCLYRNGTTSRCVSAAAPLAPTTQFSIGLAASSGGFAGIIDEVRITTTAVSAGRIDAEYANQRNAAASPFVMFGTPEVEP